MNNISLTYNLFQNIPLKKTCFLVNNVMYVIHFTNTVYTKLVEILNNIRQFKQIKTHASDDSSEINESIKSNDLNKFKYFNPFIRNVNLQSSVEKFKIALILKTQEIKF